MCTRESGVSGVVNEITLGSICLKVGAFCRGTAGPQGTGGCNARADRPFTKHLFFQCTYGSVVSCHLYDAYYISPALTRHTRDTRHQVIFSSAYNTQAYRSCTQLDQEPCRMTCQLCCYCNLVLFSNCIFCFLLTFLLNKITRLENNFVCCIKKTKYLHVRASLKSPPIGCETKQNAGGASVDTFVMRMFSSLKIGSN